MVFAARCCWSRELTFARVQLSFPRAASFCAAAAQMKRRFKWRADGTWPFARALTAADADADISALKLKTKKICRKPIQLQRHKLQSPMLTFRPAQKVFMSPTQMDLPLAT